MITAPITLSMIFLLVNVAALLAILWGNRRPQNWVLPVIDREGRVAKKENTQATARQKIRSPAEMPGRGDAFDLPAADILQWEFEYARTTASEALTDRHNAVNFYLIAVGVIGSGVVAVLSENFALPKSIGTLLLWLLCTVGWIYFLMLIRLRQSWHDSAEAMNCIKEFYIAHADKCSPDDLRRAFRWQAGTLPAPDKPWTVFFYSAALIGLLDSVAYAAGGMLLHDLQRAIPWWHPWLLAVFGGLLFAYHIGLYFAFLKPASALKAEVAHKPDRD